MGWKLYRGIPKTHNYLKKLARREDRQRMRNRPVLCEADHQQRDEPPAAQVLIQVLPPGGEARLRIYPLINDHARAPACVEALQALARQWLEEPSDLARLCEVDVTS